MKVLKIYKLTFLLILFGQFNQQLALPKEEVFKQELKKLVSANVFWARSYIIAELSDSPDKDAIKKRLLKNQQKFGKALAPIFGKDNSNKITNLLQEHKNITLNLIKEVKVNNQKQIKSLEKKWYANIKEIAIFLHKLNPKWSVYYLTHMFNGLLKLTKQEMVLRAKKEWEADIKNFDKILEYAYYMADNLADGIIDIKKKLKVA